MDYKPKHNKNSTDYKDREWRESSSAKSKAIENKKGEKKIKHFEEIKKYVSGGKESKGFNDPFWYNK